MMQRYKIQLLVFFTIVVLLASSSVIAQDNNELKVFIPSETPKEKYLPDEIIVKFKGNIKDIDIERINSVLGTKPFQKSDIGKFNRLKIPKDKNVAEMVALYKKMPDVEYAEPNYVAHALFVPNDPYFVYQWHLNQINSKDAWDISNGSNVIVAVVDTGVAYEDYCQIVSGALKCYYKAPDLAGTTFVQGYDFANNDNHANDDQSHGTHVTGTVAQTTNNGAGVAGVAFKSKIMPIKVLDSSGSGLYSWIADGIRYAADNGAKVISMSLGGPSPSITLENALAYAYSKNVTIIAAAGNDGNGGAASYPAAYNAYVIAVAATRYDETRSYYSTTGSYVDVAAPGGDITVDQNGDGYGDGVLQQTFNPNTKQTNSFGYYFFQGTSMATPHVSGVAALLIANGKKTPADVREAIEKTAKDKGTAGKDPEYGWGIINAKAALLYTGQICTDNDQDSYCAETNDCNDNNALVHPNAADSLCNGIDNDCDLLIDEGYIPFNCGFGACQAQSICSNGIESCTPHANLSSAETCDGIDNDCNNLTDEGLTAPLCENQIGVCAGSTKTCGGIAGWMQCSASNYGPNYESQETSCSDGLDNDCDGFTDINDINCLVCVDNDGDGYGTNCQLGNDCNDNNAAINPGASDANCDGIDNNCNILIDEGYVPTATNCGIGACASTGQLICQNGTQVNTCIAGTPTNEICNGVDDNCNNLIDDGLNCSVKCWSGSNIYLLRNTNQFKKFCKCAQGTYAYNGYTTISKVRTVYQYIDAGDNTNWATSSISNYGVSRVKCPNGAWYKTDQDYYK